MNTTFTTYAEKKAKQFLNLLQGYTKGIRMTAILILLLMGVNNAWAGYTWYSGDLLYYDFSAVSGGVNWNDGNSMQYDGSGGGKVKKVEFSSTINMDNTWGVAKTDKGGWSDIKFSNPPSVNQRRFIINSDGKTASWGYLDKYIAGDNWGEIGSWSTTTKKMTNNNNGTYTINFTSITASAHEFKIVNYDTWTGAIGHSENVSCINGTVTNRDGNIKFTPYIEGDVTITYDVSTGKTVITCATASVSATITPTVGTTGTNNLTFSITSNVPTNSGYYVGVYNFGEEDYASGYINGDKSFTSNPIEYTATYTQNTAGTYYTRAFVMKNSEILATSEKIAFTVNAGSSVSTVSEWKMYNGDTELGTFTNEGNDTYTLTITIPEGGYAQTNYRNNLGNIGTPGAFSLLNNEQNLDINNGRLRWQDSAGTFTITIRKDGEIWKISAIKQSTQNIYLVGQFNGWTENNDYKFEETEPGIYTLTKHFDKRERYNATDASQAEWEFKLLVDGTKYTVEGEGAAKVLQYTRQNTTKVLSDGHPYGSDPYYNLLLQADQTGDYVFTYNANTQVLTVTHPEYSPSASYIVGDFSDGANGTDAMPKDEGAGKDWTEEYGVRIDNNSQVCFPNGASWNFKIKINGIWYGAENLVISESGTYILSDDYADAGQRNCAILTSVSGCYNFSYVDNGNGTITLTVGYPEVETTPIYLKPNSNWKADNARFAAYLFGNGETWVDMKEVGCSGIYTCDIPAGYPNIIFCRMNPNIQENRWNKDSDGDYKPVWNQTNDLTIPTNGDNQYTVQSGTWDKGGGTWGTYSPNIEISLNHGDNGTIKLSPSSPVTINTEVTVTMAPNEGYTFKSGTIEIGNQEQQISTTTSTHTICGPTNITAQWTANTYIVTLDQQYGEGGTTSVTATYGAAMPTATMPRRTGYIFGGYYTEQNGLGTQYYNADGTSTKNWDKTERTTLHAKWAPITYYVQFDANGGEGSMEKQEFTYNVPQNLTTNAFTKTGYNFRQWNTKADGSGTPYADKNSVNNLTTTNGEKITLYAQWEAIRYNITYTSPTNGTYCLKVGEGEDWHGNTTAIYEQQITLKVQSEAIGYHFVGWTVTKNSGGTITVTDDKFTMPAEDVTVAATFEPNIYTITYKDKGGETFSGTHEAGHPTQHTYATDTQLKGAGKMGYTFLGWFTNKECTEGPITTLGATAYTANITLYAKWEIRNLYIHADFVNNWEGIRVEPEFKNNTVVYTYTDILEKKESTYNNEHTIWDGGHHFHYLYSLEGIDKPETQKIAYNYYNVDAENISYTQDLIDAVHLTDDNNPTIQFGLTKKSKVTITLTLRSDIETDDKTTQPDVAIVAIPCNIITLDQDEEGLGTEGSVHTVEVPNGDPMPAITGNGSLPTGANGYIFKGYYDQPNGQGTQYYNQEGTAYDNKTWDKTEDATLYAYFEKAQITQITLNKEIFEPVPTGKAYVIATPTIEPDNVGEVIVCWRLLYNDGTPVEGYGATDADGNEGNSIQFSIVGLATGSYKIEATLHAGSACGNGEPLSTLTKNFIIASEYTVTVKYTCDNQEIKASTTAPAQATETTDITAPDIFGYTFKEWTLGDGVSSESTLTDKTISYTAIYDGTITAKYTKRKLIYLDLSKKFSESDKWSDPYIYLYGSEGYWDNNKGAGATGSACVAKGAMTKIEGTDIWYYDYSNVAGFTKYLAFTWGNHTNAENFHSCDVIYRGDFSEGTPLFVPATDQTKEDINGAKYYSKGYWVNYIGEHTGYTLIIYNEAGNTELIRQKFTSVNKRMNMTSVIDLEAEHKYQYEVLRDYGYYYKHNSSQLTNTDRGFKPLNTADKGTIVTTAAGDYTFTLGYWSGDLQISVEYPAAVGDYRILYRDNGTTNWSGNPRSNNWCHPSRIIKKKEDAKDIISFFINHDKNPELQYQTVNSIDAATGKITWSNARNITVDWNQIDTSGVYNFVFVQDGKGISLENTIEPYTGNYYIRCDAFGDKWDNYDINPENRMTYSAFSESEANSFGEKFSHYAVEWCPRGTNVKFTIANDYSPCITDTLIRDIEKTWDENMDEHGNLKSDGSEDPTADKYSANIRFMWNRKTNKISRAYLSSATNVTKKFLILQGDEKMADSDGNAIAATTYVPANATLLQDKENWIYETTIKVQPGARVKLYACYTKTAVEDAQYFRGKKGEFNDENTVQILGGEGDTWYTMRVIYDFKTNRLLAAWIPDTQIGDEGLQIDADIMIIREHQEEATCINLTEHTNSKLTDVKTVYGVMRFNRWVLNNRANPDDLDIDHCSTVKDNNRQYDEEKVKDFHPVLPLGDQKSIYERSLYFISFPFDVKVSDIFGFGTYWNEWYIEYYDGLKRAREGFFIDSPPNWKYVTPEMADTFKLRAYQGYILGVDLDYMQYDNTSFWAHNIQEIELFFPSTTTMGEICRTEVVMPALGPEYECKINRPNSDHRVIDSYWRCIGVPSYANYDGLLYTDADKKQSITWKTDYTWKGDYSEFPFLYAWNTTDNTITPHSTTTFKFKTMHSYLVQHKDKIHWSAISTKPSSIVAKERNEATRNYEWKITLSRNEKLNDQTFIRMADREDITTEFDFNQDLSKEFNYGRSDIYTLIGYEKAAANSLPITETTTLIPLGLSIEFNGDYTIAMPDRMENIGVTLIDTESNTRTNLSAGMEYVVTLNKGDYNNRFFIEISPIQQTPTDIEYVENSHDDQARKVLIDNILYIVRDGQIFDARGARVK